MELIQLIGVLVAVGVVLWALNYLFAKYIRAEILELINKIAVVAIVLYTVFWVLQLAGVVPAGWQHRALR